MSERLRNLLTRWSLRDWGDGEESPFDLHTIKYLGDRVFDDYEPSQFDRFENRLDQWLHNMEEEAEQRVLFHVLNRLFFIGRPEFESLCRAAFHGPVVRWLVDELNINIVDENAAQSLTTAVERTWFCPITDSMRINAFLKVNGLIGKSHRPDWRSLKKFGSPDLIRAYVAAENIDRLVLLEDFVGSGTQMRSTITFASSISPNLRILACPLVTCPAGHEIGEELARNIDNVAYEPAMQITSDMLIKADAQPDEPSLFEGVRALTRRVASRLGPTENDPESRRYHGYRGTGAVVALYSNCPNNSLPIIHDETTEWKPLFPRLKRG